MSDTKSSVRLKRDLQEFGWIVCLRVQATVLDWKWYLAEQVRTYNGKHVRKIAQNLCPDAQYPMQEYCYGPHRMRL